LDSATTDQTGIRPTVVRWRILALLLAFSFMSWFNRVSMSVAADERIMKQFTISEEQMGVVYSALFFGYTIFMTPGGWFADRFGGWRALLFMGLGSGLFTALTGAVGWYTPLPPLSLFGYELAGVVLAFLCVRCLLGICTAPIYPSSGRIIAHWLPAAQHSWANGMVMGAALVGNASTFLVFGALIDRLDWPRAFLVAALATAAFAIFWGVYARSDPVEHSAVNRAELALIRGAEPAAPVKKPTTPAATAGNARTGAWTSLLRNRSLVFLTLSYVAVGYFEYLFYFWIHHYFEKVLQLGTLKSRYAATIVMLTMAVGMIVGGWAVARCQRRLGYRLGRAAVPVVGMTASALLLLLGLVAEEPVWIVLWFALALGAVGASEGPFWATAVELGGKRGATAAGIFNTGGNAGGFLAPMVTPWVSAHLPSDWNELVRWKVAISLGGVICLLGVSLWVWIDPRERVAEQIQTS
jgi:MFS family permease